MSPSADKTHIVVESTAAWRHAESLVGSDVVWETTSPYVQEMLTMEGRTVIPLDGGIRRETADGIGYVALDAACKIGDRIDDDLSGGPDGQHPGEAMKSDIHRMLTSLFYKAFLLRRLRHKLGDGVALMTVGGKALSPVQDFSVMPDHFDTIFTVLGSRLGLPTIEFTAPRPVGQQSNGDFMVNTWWTRALTAVNAPLTSILFRVWRRFFRHRPLRLFPGKTRLHVGILSDNELIEEIFLHLLWRGATVHRIPPYAPPPVEEPMSPPVGDPERLCREIKSICAKTAADQGLSWSEEMDCAADLGAARILKALSIGLSAAAGMAVYCAGLKERIDGASPSLVANSMLSPVGKLLQAEIRRAGILLHVVEHGAGPGLDRVHQALYERHMGSCVEGVFAHYYSPCSRKAVEESRGAGKRSSIAVGTPAITRKINQRWGQRWALRRKMGVKGRLVTWVMGLYPNNYLFLPHYYLDTPYHEIRKRIVYDILGKTEDTVLLKLYPTFRYVDPDPFAGLMALPRNVRYEHLIDFRNFRAAPDVVMLDGAGSSLAWCWSCNVPLIYVETGMMPLLPEIADLFRSALFYVDIREENWRQRLEALLARPHDQLVADYKAMAEKRCEVEDYCVFGAPGNAGAKGAQFILNAADGLPS